MLCCKSSLRTPVTSGGCGRRSFHTYKSQRMSIMKGYQNTAKSKWVGMQKLRERVVRIASQDIRRMSTISNLSAMDTHRSTFCNDKIPNLMWAVYSARLCSGALQNLSKNGERTVRPGLFSVTLMAMLAGIVVEISMGTCCPTEAGASQTYLRKWLTIQNFSMLLLLTCGDRSTVHLLICLGSRMVPVRSSPPALATAAFVRFTTSSKI